MASALVFPNSYLENKENFFPLYFRKNKISTSVTFAWLHDKPLCCNPFSSSHNRLLLGSSIMRKVDGKRKRVYIPSRRYTCYKRRMKD